ncbi:MAG: hypothetical protein ACE5HX_06950, partial [bacterium]
MVKKRSQIYFLLFLFIGCNVKSQLQAAIPARLKSNRSNLCQPSLVNFQLKQNALNAVFQKPGSHRMEHPINNISRLDFQSAQPRKSKGRAFLRSLILPGWGQHYAKSKTM